MIKRQRTLKFHEPNSTIAKTETYTVVINCKTKAVLMQAHAEHLNCNYLQ